MDEQAIQAQAAVNELQGQIMALTQRILFLSGALAVAQEKIKQLEAPKTEEAK